MRRIRNRKYIRTIALALALALVAAACSTDTTETSRLEADLSNIAAENAALAEDLAAAAQELSEAQASISELAPLADELTPLADELAQARDEVEALKVEVDELRSDRTANDRAVRDAESALKSSQDQIQTLVLAYDADIAVASNELSQAAQEFACAYGKEALGAGKGISSLSSTKILRAFLASDTYSSTVTGSESVASLMDFVSDPEDALNAPTDEILQSPAAACWQAEDAKVNATLYEHADVLRAAVLDAACTNGADVAYDDWDGYRDTAEYQSWKLTVGGDASYEYQSAIDERYGSLESFLAIPDAQLKAEDARCIDDRDLIESKFYGTWNVGDEIKAGTWKAFDVSDCYWARLATNGDIRDNNFGDALRVSVNVSPSDGQFEIDGCLFYYANP